MKKNILLVLIFIVNIVISQAQNVFTVTNTTDPNPFLYSANHDDPIIVGSLQWAVRKANDATGSSLINFNIPGSTQQVIYLNYSLPSINKQVTIDGTTQAGYLYGQPTIIIDGNSLISGISIYNNSGSLIKGIHVRNFTFFNLRLEACNNLSIIDNLITQAQRNAPSNASSGLVFYDCNSIIIKGNYIGVNFQGSNLGNADYGIFGSSCSQFIIGSTISGEENSIAHNGNKGICIFSGNSNKLSGNLIYDNPVGIYFSNGTNNNIQPPVITSYSGETISGTSQPNDIIEIFGSTGNENANEYLGSTTADASGNWATTVTSNNWNYAVATATDGSGNTSILCNSVEKIQIPGSSQINAMLIAPTQDFSYAAYNMEVNQTEFWFKFVAVNNNYIISVKPMSQIACADIKEVFLYSVENNNLLNIGYSNLNDSLLIFSNELISSNVYFIKVKRQITNCNDFNIVVQPDNNSKGFDYDYACYPTCENYIPNGSFDEVYDSDGTVDYYSSFYNNENGSSNDYSTDVCGWHTAWGTPQLSPNNTTPYPAVDHIAQLWYGPNSGNMVGEGLYTWLYLPLLTNVEYQLSIKYRNSGDICTNWQVRLTNLALAPGAGYSFGEPIPNFNSYNSQLITSQSHSNDWITITVPVNPTSNWSKLCIYPSSSMNNQQTVLYINDISIVATKTYLDNQTICAGQGTTLTASEGISYLWSNQVGTTQSIYVEPANTTTYTVTVTDANYCEHIEEVTVFVDQFNVTINPVINMCNNASAQIGNSLAVSGGSGNYSYEWFPSTGLNNSTIANPTTNTTVTTTYYVNVTDNNTGCVAFGEVTVKVNPLSVTSTVSQLNCSNPNSGLIDITVTGGTSPYTYLWSNNATTQDISSLSAGTYTVTVTDINNCTVQYSTSFSFSSPIANFSYDEFNKAEEIPVTFYNLSTNATSYEWDFGDPISASNTSTLTEPTHTFIYPGYYHVTLKAINGSCYNSISKDIYIVPSINNYNPSNCVKLFSYNKPGNTTISASDNWTTSNYPSGKITIQGALIIEPNVTLTVNGVDLNFGPEGKIIIKEKGTLNLSNSKLTSIVFSTQPSCGCPADMRMMWQGIEVWGNGYSSSASEQGKLNINSGVTIEDSYYGIVLGKFMLYSSYHSNPLLNHWYMKDFHELNKGGKLTIAPGTIFNRNLRSIGIFEKKYPYSAGDNIHGCSFICKTNAVNPINTKLLDPYSEQGIITSLAEYNYFEYHNPLRHVLGFYSLSDGKSNIGIYVMGVKDVWMYDNYFENVEKGIYSRNSKIKVYNSVGNGNQFKNNTTGIFIDYWLSDFYGSSVLNNYFANNKIGIYINGGISEYIKGNNFDESQLHIGVSLTESSSFKVVDNTFYFNQTGIFIANSGNGGGLIGYESSGNSFLKCQKSILAKYDNHNLKIKCNTFDNSTSSTSEYISNWDVQGSIADQGNMPNTTDAIPDYKEPAGNRMNITDNITKKDIKSSTTFNYFYHGTHAVNNPYEPVEPGGVDNISIVPTPVSSSTYFIDACIPYISSNDPIGTDAEIDLIDYVIDQAQNDFNNLTANLDKGQTSMLLDAITSNINAGKLKNMLVNASPLSDNVLIEVINSSNPLAPGLFKDVMIPNSPVSDNVMEELEPKLNTLPAGIAKQIRNAQGYNSGYVTPTTLSRLIKYNEMERQLFVNNLVDYYVNNDLISEALDLLEGETTQVAKQILTATYIDMENASLARAKLNSMDINTQDDMAFYNLYSMYIDLLEAGKTIEEPDSAQLLLIREIAGLCPPSLATVNAQALLSYLFNEYFEPCNDSLTAKSKKLNITLKSQNQIYLGNNIPNPFKNTTKIPYFLNEDITAAYIEIYDLTGKPVKKYDLSADKNILELSLDDLGNGVYSYSLIVNGIRKATKQMVLIK